MLAQYTTNAQTGGVCAGPTTDDLTPAPSPGPPSTKRSTSPRESLIWATSRHVAQYLPGGHLSNRETHPSPQGAGWARNRQVKITTDLFVVPHTADRYLLYAPLQRWALLANQDSVDLLAALERGEPPDGAASTGAFLELLKNLGLVDGPGSGPLPPASDGPDTFHPTQATLFLTTCCNLRCVYCYASAGESRRTMAWPVARAAVDEIVRNAVITGTKGVRLGFHGGGEPTLPFGLFTRIVEYAEAQATQHGLELAVSTATNGILAPGRREWLLTHLTEIGISLDGLPAIQNSQRPRRDGRGSFDQVAATLDRVQETHLPFGIRATVTQGSAPYLVKLVDLVAKRWPRCRSLHAEPVFNCGRCTTNGVAAPDDAAFVEAFLHAWRVARDRHVNLDYSGARLGLTTNAFCQAAEGNFCVTPTGRVTSCFEVSDIADPRAGVFFFGRYHPGQGRFVFDREKLAGLRSLVVIKRAFCADCFIKWHCAGDCAAKVLHSCSDWERAAGSPRCAINQAISKELLIDSACASERAGPSTREEEHASRST
jgi:uncharacterized protein